MTDRIHCCIAGCRCSMKNRPGYGEWICAKHWKSTDEALRTRHKIARAKARKARKAKPFDRDVWIAAFRDHIAAWKAVVDDAQIKAAFGVDGAGGARAERAGAPG